MGFLNEVINRQKTNLTLFLVPKKKKKKIDFIPDHMIVIVNPKRELTVFIKHKVGSSSNMKLIVPTKENSLFQFLSSQSNDPHGLDPFG